MKNLHNFNFQVSAEDRSRSLGNQPVLIWLTGLSASGKSTIADKLDHSLTVMGKHTMVLDGDTVRNGLNRDLGFSDDDRNENIRRIAEVSRLMMDAGLMVIAAFITPTEYQREMVRSIIGEDRFILVFIDTPLSECEKRDQKGLYIKARNGEIANFTGVDSIFEIPSRCDIRIDTTVLDPEAATDQIVELLRSRKLLN